MDQSRQKSAIARSLAIISVAICLIIPHVQSQTPPSFTVSSVKRNSSVNASSSSSYLPGGGFSARFTTLGRLILNAYRIKDYQLSGGPSWINSERYDVDAKAEGNPNRDQVRLMVQSLLAERFQLKVRQDNRELPIYTLLLAKSGVKFEKAPDRATNGFDVGTGRLTGYGVSMAELADQLSRFLDRPVIDRTGIVGSFDLKLQYAPVVQANPTSPAPSAPDIVTAIEEQIGLRLEATKAEIEVLVIDHAEKPSEN
jgi:bla regulator protein blaR1